MDDLIQHYIEGYYEKKILSLKKPWDGFWLGDFVDKNKSKNICQRITPPFSNVSDYLRHNVGKQKFINTHLNKIIMIWKKTKTNKTNKNKYPSEVSQYCLGFAS